MHKQIITITKGDQVIPYSSLRKCCDMNADFSYNYIVRFKMSFNYKGWMFNRLDFNISIYDYDNTVVCDKCKKEHLRNSRIPTFSTKDLCPYCNNELWYYKN